VQARWELRRSAIELAERNSDPKSVQLAAGSPRPTGADHIELSAGQIERLTTSCPPSAVRSLMDASQASGELRGLITEAGITYPEVWSMTFGRMWPN
jgi:hypothetical protein